MRPRRAFAFAPLLAAALGGCAGAPKGPPFVTPVSPPGLTGGARLLTEACVQRRVLVGANHFVVEASDGLAHKLDALTRAHVQRRGVTLDGAPLLSVCGVLHDLNQPAKTYAQVSDGPTAQGAPPLKVSAALADFAPPARPGLPSLLAELQLAAQNTAARARDAAPAQLSPAARELAAAIAAPHDTLLFVGLSGNSESGGKMAAQLGALVAVAVVATAAAAPSTMTFTGVTAGQQVAAQTVGLVGVQFLSADGLLMAGALVDVKSGRVSWAHAVFTPGSDPLKTETIGRGATTDRLLTTLVNRPAEQWSPPGAKVAP